MSDTRLTGEAREIRFIAKRKARYGHKEWIAWVDSSGVGHADVKNYQSIKDAMLAKGTGGTFVLIGASNAHLMLITWRLGVQMLRNCRYLEGRS